MQGTALALALHQISIPCRIFESRSVDAPELASGVVLTPNGLHVLDTLGILGRIKSRCWQSEFRTYKNDKDETTRKTVIANEELYGYKNHRLYRRVLLKEMKTMLEELAIPIVYNAKYEGIVTETDHEVVFRINGKEEQTSLLVGADGIYSSVRNYLSPYIVPEYTGVVGVLAHIDRSTVEWPYPEYEKACTIQGKPGAFFMIPEVADGSEIMVGMQVNYPEQTRAEWEKLSKDKEKQCDFYRKGYDQWHATARSIIDSVCAHQETMYLWPFMRMPKLERWYSLAGRVVIVGDAAHAVPPSSGQGVNQALEDIYSLTLILKSSKNFLKSLSDWQEMRQARIDAVYDWATNGTNVQRMPEAQRQALLQPGGPETTRAAHDPDDMRWLYQPRLEEDVRILLESQ